MSRRYAHAYDAAVRRRQRLEVQRIGGLLADAVREQRAAHLRLAEPGERRAEPGDVVRVVYFDAQTGIEEVAAVIVLPKDSAT